MCIWNVLCVQRFIYTLLDLTNYNLFFSNNLIIIYIIYVGSWMEIIFSVGRPNGVL